MGIGNLISMPLCVAIGRRPVFLGTLVLCVASSIWCANAKSLNSHIAGRDIFSLAAGQSEALAPMIVQEIFFLHERGRAIAWFVGIENGRPYFHQYEIQTNQHRSHCRSHVLCYYKHYPQSKTWAEMVVWNYRYYQCGAPRTSILFPLRIKVQQAI